MKNSKRIAAILAFLYFSSASAQQVVPFKAGDKIMFVGNSITDAGFYHSYIWLYYMTRFPDRRITIYNRGTGGDVIGQMNDRLDVEVFPEYPSVVVLTFGMNDSGYFEYYNSKKDSVEDVKVTTSFNNYQKVEEKFRKHPKIRKIIMTTAPYDATTKSTKNNLFPGKSNAISRISAFQKASAQKNNWGFIDLNKEMTEINLQRQAHDSSFSLSPGDRIHPDNGGHLVMAYFFLKAQGLVNKEVADVVINTEDDKLVKATNSTITNLTTKPSYVAFTYLAKALPYPIDTLPRMWHSNGRQSDALNIVPFTKEFNQERITVQNLEKGTYELKIDGQIIGRWMAQDFANGINLAEQMNTPQYQQAMAVRDMNQERMEIEKRFRQYNWMEFDVLKERGLLRQHNQAALDTVRALINTGFVRSNHENWTKARHAAIRDVWEAQMKLLVNKIYEINKPIPRRITIEKI